MARVLITGGSGYFGSLLLRKLIDRGHECTVLDINDAGDRPKSVDFIQADIRDDDAVKPSMRDQEFIFHNVAQVPLAKDHNLFDSVNRIGTENILAGALENKIKKVIYTSSSAIFGIPKKNPVTEDTIPFPMEAYGHTKLNGELCCKKYIDQGLDVTIIRPRTILGHGRLGIFQILFEWVYSGFNIPVLGNGDNFYQFVHAEDLAEACALASERSGPEIYNCGAAKFGTMRQVLESLCEHAGTGSRVRSIPMLPAVIAMRASSALRLSPLGSYHSLMYGQSMYFDIDLARRNLDWNPRFSNEQMLIESYEYYINNRQEILNDETLTSHHKSALKQGILKIFAHCI